MTHEPASSAAATPPRRAATAPAAYAYAALTLLATLLGLALRVEFARTFEPRRGHDYRVYVAGIQWLVDHPGRTFDASVHLQVGCQPPLWYMLGAAAQRRGATPHHAALLASLVVLGWAIRHAILARFLWRLRPGFGATSTAVLALHAVLPLSVLMDGHANPEGLHATFFTAALYTLWGAEQQARVARISLVRAVIFGLLAGAALLTKATGASAMLVGAATMTWVFVRRWRARGPRDAARAVALPALVALAVWAGAVGWWTVPNIKRYGHPFPHIYQVEAEQLVARHHVLRAPVLDRRPLGWFLPFDLDYLYRPVAVSSWSPRPNFWTVLVAGTWADFTHRGFCRNGGGVPIDIVWYGPVYQTSTRCLALALTLVRIGAWVSLPAALCVALELYRALRRWRRHDVSLALPLGVLAVLGFTMSFATTYPLDQFEVVKPNYEIAVVTPVCMCIALALARRELAARRATALHAALGVAVVLVGMLVVAERWPKPNESDGPHHGYIPGG